MNGWRDASVAGCSLPAHKLIGAIMTASGNITLIYKEVTCWRHLVPRSASEAARSCNESIQFPATKSRSKFGSEVLSTEVASRGQGYTKVGYCTIRSSWWQAAKINHTNVLFICSFTNLMQGWRGNMIPERAESELSTTSFLANARTNRFPFSDHSSSAVPRGLINWTTLPYTQDD